MKQEDVTKQVIWLLWLSIKGFVILMLLWTGSAARILYQNF